MLLQRNYTQPDTDEHIIDGVLKEFLFLCDMPHGSGNEEAISQYLINRLQKMGHCPLQDEHFNIICDLPATTGCEDAPLIAIQGHMDMVCAVDKTSSFCAETDPILAMVRDGRLCTNGTSSLGADCNIGNAAILYLLSHPNTAHGPLRLIFTTGEEIGLVGARRMDAKWVSDIPYLINTDGFQQGDIVVSSSGGRRETYLRQLETTVPDGDRAWKLELTGFLGGHSGYDIHKDRANTIKLIAVFLSELSEQFPFQITNLRGGTSHNAIPFHCEVTIVANAAYESALKSACFHLSQKISDLFSVTDPNGRLKITSCDVPARVWSHSCARAALYLCILIYNGTYSMNVYIPDRVSSSSNLGYINVNAQGQIEVRSMIRCAVDASEEIIAMQHRTAAKITHFQMTVRGYKGWPGTPENTLAQMMDLLYFRQTGHHLHVTAMHVGLETSAFYEKNPEMTLVSTGMTIHNPHSLDENVEIASIPPYVHLLHSTLKSIGYGMLSPK